MESKIKKFLEFNGKNILFLSLNGTYWVAIKPICDALEIQYHRQYKNLVNDKTLSQLLSKQTMVGADNRVRNMVALPEKYVYGWLFSINSSSDALQQYKLKCYDVLFDYFQGAVTKRTNELTEKTWAEREADTLRKKLKSDNEDFKRLCELEGKALLHGKKLKQIDREMVDNQLNLFN
jgi:hypothetical protein